MKILAEKRVQTGTSASKRARAAGKLPAVVYGSAVQSMPVLVDLKAFEDTIRAVGANGVFSLDVDGEVYKVFVKDSSSYALTPKLYHIDLQAFTAGETVVMTIPVYVVGEEKILEGNVSQSISEIEIEIAPEDAPSSFEIDASALVIGDSVTVADIKLPENAVLITEADETVMSVLAPEDISEDLEPSEASDEMPEPEVIGADEEDSEK